MNGAGHRTNALDGCGRGERQPSGRGTTRQAVREAKNWAESDRLRDEIAKLGWNVKDTKDGPKLTPR